MDIRSLAGGIMTVVIGALMLADGVIGAVSGFSIFYEGTNPLFSISVGIIALIVGGTLIEKGENS
ncbi:MAG: hypothetical protein ACE5KG_02230 [Nitrososphaerales archaeon]